MPEAIGMASEPARTPDNDPPAAPNADTRPRSTPQSVETTVVVPVIAATNAVIMFPTRSNRTAKNAAITPRIDR